MKIKRIIALVLTFIFSCTPVLAEKNDESMYMDIILGNAANLYIDDSTNSIDLLYAAVEEAVRDNPELMYELIKNAFATLDEYSEFYTAEEYAKAYQYLNDVFYGMGAVIHFTEDGRFMIDDVNENGGAYDAGILPGDEMIRVDGTVLAGMSLDEAVKLVKGDKDTVVKITILRDGREITYDVVRKEVSIQTAGYSHLEGNIGYIQIVSFSEKTASEVKEALDYFDEHKITKIILDLRNNPGGHLQSVVEIAEMFVPEGTIVQTVFRGGIGNTTYISENKNPKYECAVLVNEMTASASEVLTSAMQDSKVGYVIGKKTFGKGLIQDVFALNNGDAFKITTGYYLTRNGNYINEVGIEPDEVVLNGTRRPNIEDYTPFCYSHKWKKGETGDGVLAAKERLYLMGYYGGTLNKYFDSDLDEAVRKFQADQGLYVYGVIDYATQGAIDKAFKSFDLEVDDQFVAAYTYMGGDPAIFEE